MVTIQGQGRDARLKDSRCPGYSAARTKPKRPPSQILPTSSQSQALRKTNRPRRANGIFPLRFAGCDGQALTSRVGFPCLKLW